MSRLLTIDTHAALSPEIKAHNRALLERFMPGFMEFFIEARAEMGASITEPIKIEVPDEEVDFVMSNMEETKTLQ